LAALLDLDERTIRKFAASGIMVRADKGLYAFAPSVRNYVRHLREAASNRRPAEGSLQTESALLKAAQRQHYELKNKVASGALVPIEEIEPVWSRIVLGIRQAMLAIPGKARIVMGLDRDEAMVLTGLVRDALKTAAADES
jgi:phage terminase Nu1 subunit (DNA packaging protein)